MLNTEEFESSVLGSLWQRRPALVNRLVEEARAAPRRTHRARGERGLRRSRRLRQLDAEHDVTSGELRRKRCEAEAVEYARRWPSQAESTRPPSGPAAVCTARKRQRGTTWPARCWIGRRGERAHSTSGGGVCRLVCRRATANAARLPLGARHRIATPEACVGALADIAARRAGRDIVGWQTGRAYSRFTEAVVARGPKRGG